MADAKPRKQRRTISKHIDETKPAPRIVHKAGGLTRFCEITGFKTSTVHTQMRNGFFPNPLHEDSGLSLQAFIITRLREHGIEIDPAEFIEQEVVQAA
jgi:hypothetical protein